jgi:hypothetical protein
VKEFAEQLRVKQVAVNLRIETLQEQNYSLQALIKPPDAFKEKGCQTLESGDRAVVEKQPSSLDVGTVKKLIG